jgi:hypothetical protein
MIGIVQSVLTAACCDAVASTHTHCGTNSHTLVQLQQLEHSTGFDDPDPVGHQCGEHTFESTFNIPPRADGAPLDIMWKYFIAVSNQSLELILTPALLLLLRTVSAHHTRERTTLLLLLLVTNSLSLSLSLCVLYHLLRCAPTSSVQPKWGVPGSTEVTDPFPNMVGETGIDKQPSYDGLIDDCPVVPDRFWNREATGVQDSIEYVTLPACITPGAPWSVQVSAVCLHLIWCMHASVCDCCMHAQGHTQQCTH